MIRGDSDRPEEDRVPGALGGAAGADGFDTDCVAALAQRAFEVAVGRRGPNGEDAAGAEGAASRLKPPVAVEAGVALVGEGGRADNNQLYIGYQSLRRLYRNQ